MADIWVKRNDTSPVLQVTLQDDEGTAVNIDGATVRLYMQEMRGSRELALDGVTMDILQTGDGDEEPYENVGQVEYEWEDLDTSAEGGYYAELEVTFAAGAVETFPNSGYLTVAILADLAEVGS